MENQTLLLIIIAVFVAVSAIAMVFQAAMLYGTYKASCEVRDRVMPLVPKVEALVDTSRSAVDEARTKIADITAKTEQILDIARKQMATVEELVEDASQRTRRQLARAEMVVEDALERTQKTVELVHKGVLTPLRGITGVAAGVAAAVRFLLRGTRPDPDQVTVDEEMFI